MTALFFVLDPEGVIIATDTLSLDMDRKCSNYMTKIYPLPHLKAVICGTGSADLIIDWFSVIQREFICKDITLIGKMAPTHLRKLFNSYQFSKDTTATVYHFGYNIDARIFSGYVYRSCKNFEEEKLQYGMAIKPYNGDILQFTMKQIIKTGNAIDSIIETLKRQKEIDENQQNDEKLGIGGNIHILKMTDKYQLIWEVYQFSDYESKFSDMMDHWKKKGAIPLKKSLFQSLIDIFDLFKSYTNSKLQSIVIKPFFM